MTSERTPEQNKRLGQDNAFRKVALKGSHLTGAELERAQREQGRQAARGTHLAIYQVALRMRLLSVKQVKEILEQVKARYFFCPTCHRENVRRKGGGRVCRHCETHAPESRRSVAHTPEPPDDDWIGQKLGNCEILAKLGEGGSGTVYRARQLSLDRLVALKLLFPWLAVKEDHARRFLREARMMARVEHPNVVPVYDSGREGETLFLVMSYVEGANLGRYLAERGKLQPDEVIDFAGQVLGGLAAMHTVGVIHRDLKPENIMITPDRRAMVMDFGLVRALEGADSLTASEQILGTPFYMSPEQCLNKGVDERADIYSLGVTCYQLLSGERPFGGNNAVELIMSHLYEKPTPLRELDPLITPELAEVVGKMLAKDKRARYESARAALEDIERLRSGRTPVALEHRVQARRLTLKRRVLLAAGAVTLTIAATLVGYFAGVWDAPPDDGPGSAPAVATVDVAEIRAAAKLSVIREFEADLLQDTVILPMPSGDTTGRVTPVVKQVDRQAHRQLKALVRRLTMLLDRYDELAKEAPKNRETRATAMGRYVELGARVDEVKRRYKLFDDWIRGSNSGSGSGSDAGAGSGSGVPAELTLKDRVDEIEDLLRSRKRPDLEKAKAKIEAYGQRLEGLPAVHMLRASWLILMYARLDQAEPREHLDGIAARMRAAIRSGELEEAGIALGEARATGPKASARLSELRLELGKAVKRAADREEAARLKALSRAREETRAAIVSALDARDTGAARRALQQLARDHDWGPERVRGDELLRDVAGDVALVEAVLTGVRETLAGWVGKKETLKRREGPAISGELTRVGEGLFGMKNGGGRVVPFRLADLACSEYRRLAGGVGLDAQMTVAAYSGPPRSVADALDKWTDSAVKTRLQAIVQRRLVIVVLDAVEQLLRQRKIVQAWRELVRVNHPDARPRVRELLALLDQRAGDDFVFVRSSRKLYAAEKNKLRLGNKWIGHMRPLRAKKKKQWLFEKKGKGYFFSLAPKGFEYPFVVRCVFEMTGDKAAGGLVVGGANRHESLARMQLGVKRWTLWQTHSGGNAHLGDLRKGARPKRWRLELVVHQSRMVVRVGEPGIRVSGVFQGENFAFLPPRKGHIGVWLQGGTQIHVHTLAVQPLKKIERE